MKTQYKLAPTCVDSLLTRLGRRFAYAVNDSVTPYAGAYWEHEFAGRLRSTLSGEHITLSFLRVLSSTPFFKTSPSAMASKGFLLCARQGALTFGCESLADPDDGNRYRPLLMKMYMTPMVGIHAAQCGWRPLLEGKVIRRMLNVHSFK